MSHRERVKMQLKQLGVTAYGLKKTESKHLSKLIHTDEQLEGVIYGRYDAGSAMIVATDKRILFFDKKPLYSTSDEISYDFVSGIKVVRDGYFSTVTLHTRIGDYTLRYANKKCAQIFKQYIESHVLEHDEIAHKLRRSLDSPKPVAFHKTALDFLQTHELATLSTVDKEENVHGAIVYYYAAPDNHLYILTGLTTQKARNAYAHPQVALTVLSLEKLQTLQLQGFIEIETDQAVKKLVFSHITQRRQYGKDALLPPVLQLKDNKFVVLKITPTVVKFSDFKKTSVK